jgi:hypothetical protein
MVHPVVGPDDSVSRFKRGISVARLVDNILLNVRNCLGRFDLVKEFQFDHS